VTEYAWDTGSCDPCPTPPLEPSELSTLGGDVLRLQSNFVLTRLHTRYDRQSLSDDLIFRAAPALEGGRQWVQETHVVQGGMNNFRARQQTPPLWERPHQVRPAALGQRGRPARGQRAPPRGRHRPGQCAPRQAGPWKGRALAGAGARHCGSETAAAAAQMDLLLALYLLTCATCRADL